jgi:predicted molibdopterin-dependent oxidoreductase YjgC
VALVQHPARPAPPIPTSVGTQTVTFTIDGHPVTARTGQTVLQAALEHGFHVPSLCYASRTGPAGLCRACVAEVEGMKGLPTTCTLPVREGMVVRMDTEQVVEARRVNVELLLASGVHDCLACEASGRCELQDAAYHLGIEHPTSPFPAAPRRRPADRSSQFIVMDADRCIHCFRCIRACNDLVVNEVLDMAYRGDRSVVVCDTDVPMAASSCVHCGECVQACPTGALVERKAVGLGRPWELAEIRTTCEYCGVGCQVELHVDRAANRIVRITGVEGVPPNDGMLCLKGRFAYDFTSSPERLTTPLLRRSRDEPLAPASWDDALDFAAGRLRAIRDRDGPDAIGVISCARSTNENNYAAMKFARAGVGTNNIDHCART